MLSFYSKLFPNIFRICLKDLVLFRFCNFEVPICSLIFFISLISFAYISGISVTLHI